MIDSQIPSENNEIFALLYLIETGLRELIIDVLSNLEGQRWYRKCLSGDILEKYKRGRESEAHAPWVQCIPHHPIYYIDFPDLRKIIERKDNWERAFEPIFQRKDIFSGVLSEIEPIRNKIAHNRKATSLDVEIVKSVHNLLSTTLGSSYLSALSSRCTLAQDIVKQIEQLQYEAQTTFLVCSEYGPLLTIKIWYSIFNRRAYSL